MEDEAEPRDQAQHDGMLAYGHNGGTSIIYTHTLITLDRTVRRKIRQEFLSLHFKIFERE